MQLSSVQLQSLLMSFVRDRDNFSSENFDLITDPDNLDQSIQHLISVKRDVESQFIASKTRLQDYYADCETARQAGEMVEFTTDVFEHGSKIKKAEMLQPTVAYARFQAREFRWKVKTVRYLSLIESALTAIKNSVHQPSGVAEHVEA